MYSQWYDASKKAEAERDAALAAVAAETQALTEITREQTVWVGRHDQEVQLVHDSEEMARIARTALANLPARAQALLAVVEAAQLPARSNDNAKPIMSRGHYGGPLCAIKFLYEDGTERAIGHEWFKRLENALDTLAALDTAPSSTGETTK